MMSHSDNSRAGWRVASGHEATTQAAVAILEAGGNAADAAIAAATAACVAEPLLASLGGGVLAVIRHPDQDPIVLDAFAQTPRQRNEGPLDFYPILGHFGTDTQEFHVGKASMATPGVVAGLMALSQRFGHLPLKETLQPTIDLARGGVTMNPVQRYTLEILQPIVRSSPECARLFGLDSPDGDLPSVGAKVTNQDMADFCEIWARDGAACFYLGEPAQSMAHFAADGGGHLLLEDFQQYQVHWRTPLTWTYKNATLYSTPPPAFGGLMLAMALTRLDQDQAGHSESDAANLPALIAALDWTDRTRHELETQAAMASTASLESAFADLCRRHALVSAGTTHISVEDGFGLGVALTLSNGEGSGTVIPGTGIMMNNMLGEEDINRCGFHAWPTNRRLASMMAPTLIERGDRHWLLGSGGSNRIRSALTQVIVNLIDQNRSLEDAILAPRFHVESGQIATEVPPDCPLSIGWEWWLQNHPTARLWPDRNLYFGGVHAISDREAAADPRRGGNARKEKSSA
ncbi:MAG: gamma-glutamyltransferase [Pseudomonadota bacterium]